MSTPLAFDPQLVDAAARALSGASGFWFTRRGLMFELCRRDAWPDPQADLDAQEQAFAAALAAYEADHGELGRLVRPELAPPGIGAGDLERMDLPADLFDYAVARVALVERLDLCLMLIANGLHRGIEVALCVPPNFPSHVWERVRAQLDAGLRTTFLTIHDYSPSSGPWLAAIDAQLREHEDAEIVPAGLTMPWLSRLQLPLRGESADTEGDADAASQAPSYALIEELPPLRIMRWVYGRVATGAEDIGFG